MYFPKCWERTSKLGPNIFHNESAYTKTVTLLLLESFIHGALYVNWVCSPPPLGNSPKIAIFSKLFFLEFTFCVGNTTLQPLLRAVIVLSVVLSLSIAGTIFFVLRQWKHFKVSKAETRTEQEQERDNELQDEGVTAIRNSEGNEMSSFELHSLKDTEGQSTTEHRYQQVQRKKSPDYQNLMEGHCNVYEEVGYGTQLNAISSDC